MTNDPLKAGRDWFEERGWNRRCVLVCGRNLELVRIKDMEVHVRKTNCKSGVVSFWQGGRMPLSSQLGEMIRLKIDEVVEGKEFDEEIKISETIV